MPNFNNMSTNKRILIIGAGLTGLLAAYRLEQKGHRVTILEARNRLGGRIHTLYSGSTAPMEMGATWLGKKHQSLTKLLDELEIEIFEQALGDKAVYEPISTSPPQLVTLPPNTDPSFRIKGGTDTVIQALAQKLNKGTIHLDEKVLKIQSLKDSITVQTQQSSYEADIVISTLPPFLLTKTIQCSPALPDDLLAIASQTHTWMGESIKVGLTYKTPFWRTDNSSATIVSNVGPIPEMYEHNNFEDSLFAIKGFFSATYFSLTREERLAMVMQQLTKYYGEQAKNFISYHETVWRHDPLTFQPYPNHVLPHQNNGHQIFRQAFLGNRLFISGSETAAEYPGYMDGAVKSAEWVSTQIENA